jgi:hypothetical protein
LDIEDLVRLGRRIGTCPYYGARRALPTADLVALPYQSLLHKCVEKLAQVADTPSSKAVFLKSISGVLLFFSLEVEK